MPGDALSIEGLALNRVAFALFIGRSVFAGEFPFAIYEYRLQVIIRIATFIPRRSVADFEIHDFVSSFIYQTMSVASARLEASTHSGAELAVTFVGMQRGVPLNDVDELVLSRVP